MKKLQHYTLWLICFALSLGFSFAQTPTPEEEIFVVVENQPEPAEGMEKFYNYVAKNLKYPEQARKEGIEGRVFLQFIVREDGSLTDVKLLKGIGGGCDEEAMKIIQNAEKWKPGTQRGKAVNVRMSIPIVFKLGGMTEVEEKIIEVVEEEEETEIELEVELIEEVDEIVEVELIEEEIAEEKSSPLIILDGVISNEYALKSLDPKDIESIDVLKGETAIARYGEKGKDGVVLIHTKAKANPLVIIDGVEQSSNYHLFDMESLRIESIEILKGETATSKYGEKGKYGVILIQTKRAAQAAEVEIQTPSEYTINLYPNPSRKIVNIDLEIPQDNKVQITAHNQLTGKQLTILEQNYKAGKHTFAWEVSNLEADTYILQIMIGEKMTYRRVVVEK